MRAFWQMWESYFSKHLCDNIIRQASLIAPINATTFGGAQDLRRSKVRWLNRNDQNWDWLYGHIENIFKRANSSFSFDLNYFHELQFTEYEASYAGHYGWHEDLKWIPENDSNIQRKLSMVIQLSDPSEYQGGNLELEIPHQSPDVFRLKQIGTAIVFPSFVKHRVTPVTQGKRYSLVTWYEGPPFR